MRPSPHSNALAPIATAPVFVGRVPVRAVWIVITKEFAGNAMEIVCTLQEELMITSMILALANVLAWFALVALVRIQVSPLLLTVVFAAPFGVLEYVHKYGVGWARR